MAIHAVLVWPHKGLREKAEPVTDFKSEETVQLVADLRGTLKAYRAQGIAATQIDSKKRVIVVKDMMLDRVLINPEYLSRSDEKIKAFEGCLSFPGVRVRIERSVSVKISYFDEDGNPHVWEPVDLEAVAIQHEMDHLDGAVMLDHIPNLERKIALRRLNKIKKRLGAYAK